MRALHRVMLMAALVVAAGVGVLSTTAVEAQKKTIRLAVTDVEGLESLQREFGAFKKVLSEKTGMEVKFYPVPNRTAGVHAVKAKHVDFVLTGPAEYVVFKKLTNAKPLIGFSRPDYFGVIVVNADSGITDIKQLKGYKVAMGSVGSTSKHLTPMQLLADGGLNPLKDIKPIHTGIKTGWEAMKRGDVVAFGTTNDKFLKIRAKDDREPGSYRVIARSRDLPNDVLLVAPHVDAATAAKVRQVFTQYSDELIKAILVGEDNQKYTGMKFLGNVKDSDYNYVRSMYKTIGHPQFSAFVGD